MLSIILMTCQNGLITSSFAPWTYAPLQRINEISTASLEKILVDLFSDKEFISFQGNEIYKIFQNAFKTYTINESTMLRYTDRKKKKKKDKINALLQTIK